MAFLGGIMRRAVTTTQALTIISNANAFAKNVETINPSAEPRFDDPKNSWGFLVRQLQDPENYRPARSVPNGADRTTYFNPETGEWLRRYVNPTKGAPKPGAVFTKKTAVSLLPQDGRMNFFSQKNGIVLVFDSAQCNVKQYVFDHNITSNGRWWLRQPDPAKRVNALQRSTTLDAIRELHRAARRNNITPEWNEILPGLSADAVIAVAVPKNDPIRRLNAQYRRLLLRRELNIDVPLLIMTPEADVHEYAEAMQLEDLANAKASDSKSISRDFFNAIIALDPALVAKLPRPTIHVDIFQAIRDRDIEMINLALTQHPDDVKKIQTAKTPIQLAVELGHWDCVIEIATVVKTDKSDTAQYGLALREAAKANQQNAALALVEAGAPATSWNNLKDFSVDEEHYYGLSATHYAIQHNNTAVLEAILKKCPGAANYKHKSEHFNEVSPLSAALALNKKDAVWLLLQNSGVPNDKDNTWAVWAAQQKKWDAIYAYVDHINDNAMRSKAAGLLLHEAVLQNNLDAVKKLASKKPTVSHLKGGRTSIQLAAELGRWDCVIEIATVVQTDKGDIAQYGLALREAAKANQQNAALALVEAGAPATSWNNLKDFSVDEEHYYGLSATHYAIQHNNTAVLEAILKKCPGAANYKHKSEHFNEVSPLSAALALNKKDAVWLLLQNSGVPNDKDNTWAVWAAQQKKWDAIYAYVDHINDNAMRSKAAGLLLHEAVRQDNLDAVKKLVSKERENITKQLISFESEVKDQIDALNEEIAELRSQISQQSNTSRISALFSGISNNSKISAIQKKDHKKNALEKTLELVRHQLSTGDFISQEKFSELDNVLSKNSGWKDGVRSQRTVTLVSKAKLLMSKQCVKRQSAATSAVARAGASDNVTNFVGSIQIHALVSRGLFGEAQRTEANALQSRLDEVSVPTYDLTQREKDDDKPIAVALV